MKRNSGADQVSTQSLGRRAGLDLAVLGMDIPVPMT
jgi:hypothetical protein